MLFRSQPVILTAIIKIDLAVAYRCNHDFSPCPATGFQDGRVDILLGNGDGTFQPATTYVFGRVSFAALADLNGDGRADLVVAFCGDLDCAPSIDILLSDATGTLQFSTFYPAGDGQDAQAFITVADVNGDGKPDLLVTNHCVAVDCVSSNSGVILLLGKGDGTFSSPPVSLTSGGVGPTSVAVADLNHDGQNDLIVTNDCGNADCSAGNVAVLLANPDGSYQPAQTYTSGTNIPVHVVVGDVNQDGVPDLVAAANGGSGSPAGLVEVFLGNGNGTFQPAQNYDSGGDEPQFVAISDFNRDTEPDVVVANEFARPDITQHGTIGVLLNGVVVHTDTALAASPGNPLYGQTVTLTATVASAGDTAPTGTVTFLDGTSGYRRPVFRAGEPESRLGAGNAFPDRDLPGQRKLPWQFFQPAFAFSIQSRYADSADQRSELVAGRPECHVYSNNCACFGYGSDWHSQLL
jgi:hypothetical protein